MADPPDNRPPPRVWSAPDCPAWADDDTLAFSPADARALAELARDQARRDEPEPEPPPATTKTRSTRR